MRQLFTFIQFNGDNRCICNLHCPECYGKKFKTYQHYWNERPDLWEQGLERLNRDIYGVFSYGEALVSKGLYEMIEIFERHPTWTLNIITNFIADPTRLLNTKLAKEKRLFLVTCWHPEGVDNIPYAWEIFKEHLLQAKAAGVPVHVMMVWMPFVIERFPYYFEWLDKNDFRVSVRRFVHDKVLNTVPLVRHLPWFAGTYTLAKYSDVERKFLYASTSPKVTAYALDLEKTRGKYCSAGKDMILVKYDGTVTLCAGLVAKQHKLGNLFDPNFKLKNKFIRCPSNSCGGDFGMLHLIDSRFGSLPKRLEHDTFISQTEEVPQASPVPYKHRAEMLEAVEELKRRK